MWRRSFQIQEKVEIFCKITFFLLSNAVFTSRPTTRLPASECFCLLAHICYRIKYKNTKIQKHKTACECCLCLFTSVAELRCSQHKGGNRVSLAFSSKELGQKQMLNVWHLIMEKDCKTLLMLSNLGGIGFQTPNPNLGPKHTPLKFFWKCSRKVNLFLFSHIIPTKTVKPFLLLLFCGTFVNP